MERNHEVTAGQPLLKEDGSLREPGWSRQLSQPPMDTMVIATPWKEKKTAFYYNQKINCMRAEGTFTWGSHVYRFCPEDSFATLDWGRGVWTYDNRWYWGSGNGIVDGHLFGFNIGYGFGDTTAASERQISIRCSDA